MMLLMNKDGSYYHSNILDAIDEELTKDFDEKTAAALRTQISARLTQMMADTSDDHSDFQKELNHIYYPLIASFQVIEKYGIPGELLQKFLVDIWDQIPEDKKNEELWNALNNK